jgi:DNA recombination protein RmuC
LTACGQPNKENAFEIAATSGALYDKFEGFVADLIKNWKEKSTKTEYSGAMNKLVEGKGNLIISGKTKKDGAKAKNPFLKNISKS